MGVKIWHSDYSDDYSYCYDIDSFLRAIKGNKVNSDFTLESSYNGNKVSNNDDFFMFDSEDDIVYTDNEHPVCLGYFESYIYRDFFEKYKERIVPMIQQQIIENDESYIVINNYIFSDDFLKRLISEYNGECLVFRNVELTDEQINLLKENSINAEFEKDGRIIELSGITQSFDGDYDLTLTKKSVSSKISDEELEDFSGFSEITIENASQYEDEYYTNAQRILKKLDSFETKMTVKVDCYRRIIFNDYFLDMDLKNIDLVIRNDFYDYSYEEYVDEELVLNSMIEDILSNDYTPFEKYIQVYDIVKNFKPYNEVGEHDDVSLSRDLRHILKNEYIVCVGYVKLFRELLQKVGIESCIYYTSVDSSYDKGFTLEDKPLEYVDHALLIVNLVDKKYDINGFYMSDPTSDNSLSDDLYVNMIMPFDYMQRSDRLFKLQEVDYIFDVHNADEFNQRVEALFWKVYERKMKKNHKGFSEKEKVKNCALEACYYVIYVISETIKHLDYSKYVEANEIWTSLLCSGKDFESQINQFKYFINYISIYIVNRSNKELGFDTIIRGVTSVKTKEGIINSENTEEFVNCLSFNLIDQDYEQRPYRFPKNYLSDSDDGVSIIKKRPKKLS